LLTKIHIKAEREEGGAKSAVLGFPQVEHLFKREGKNRISAQIPYSSIDYSSSGP
jgi:hypothetical protein